jgi:hypothetical protein
MGWEKKYPILKDYPDIISEELITYFTGQVGAMVDKLMEDYDLSLVDAFLVAKDILAQEYSRRK